MVEKNDVSVGPDEASNLDADSNAFASAPNVNPDGFVVARQMSKGGGTLHADKNNARALDLKERAQGRPMWTRGFSGSEKARLRAYRALVDKVMLERLSDEESDRILYGLWSRHRNALLAGGFLCEAQIESLRVERQRRRTANLAASSVWEATVDAVA